MLFTSAVGVSSRSSGTVWSGKGLGGSAIAARVVAQPAAARRPRPAARLATASRARSGERAPRLRALIGVDHYLDDVELDRDPRQIEEAEVDDEDRGTVQVGVDVEIRYVVVGVPLQRLIDDSADVRTPELESEPVPAP